MRIEYKIKGLSIKENWFSNNPCNIKFSLIVYRDCRVNKNVLFCIKKEKFTLITDLSLKKEDIFKKFTSNLRNEIRKVEKINNLKISYNIDKEVFIDFYNEFAKHKNLSLLTKQRINKYQDNLFFICAYLEDELSNVQVYIKDDENKIARLLFSVSTIYGLDDKTKRNKIGWINKALHWKSILYFKEKGYKEYDWGGYSNNPNNKELAGIDKFKKAFGGEIIQVYDYYSIGFYILNQLKEIFQ